MIRTKSAYDPKAPHDGVRVLVDPTWPTGLPRGKAAGVEWMRELYPSQSLREWMRRNPRKIDSFKDRYLRDLARKETAVAKVCRLHAENGNVTILAVPSDEPWPVTETLTNYLRATCE